MWLTSNYTFSECPDHISKFFLKVALVLTFVSSNYLLNHSHKKFKVFCFLIKTQKLILNILKLGFSVKFIISLMCFGHLTLGSNTQ